MDDLNNVGNIPANPAPEPTGAEVAKNAATAAILAVTNGTSSQSTQDAVKSLSQGVTALAEQVISAAGGPIAGLAADAVLPEFIPAIVNTLAQLLNHIGIAATDEFKDLQAWIASKV